MIDLHTHSLLSDGALLPSELVRRASVVGYRAIGIADHVDSSNIDFVVTRIVKASKGLSSAKIKVIAGIELTHVPQKGFSDLIRYARKNGVELVIAHGETLSEPVTPGTNALALESDIDILAHPGLITLKEAKLATRRGIYLELTGKKGHSLTNGHVAKIALCSKARLVFNTDAHNPEDLLSYDVARPIVLGSGLTERQTEEVFKNSLRLLKKFKKS